LYSTLLYVKREGLIGLQAANASTQLTIFSKGDKAGTILLQSWWQTGKVNSWWLLAVCGSVDCIRSNVKEDILFFTG
jgi:hypothetical protein